MKKSIRILAVIIITAFFIFYINNRREQKDYESRGIFISYVEYLKYFHNKSDDVIKSEIDKIVMECNENSINTIYLHVRPFSDSIYNSKLFPFTHTISGIQGKEINFDVLKYFIEKSHSRDIKVHAWINPYRISNQTDISSISKDNPAYKWLNTNHVKVIEDKGIFYNPASNEVKELIVAGVIEVAENYDIDGILFDDYFYPDDTIDLESYKEVEGNISLQDYRLSQVNELISKVYKKIKETKPNVLFGISPDGNITNNYEKHYADVKTWLEEDGYIDYIMPQIYYGFFHQTKPFIKTINEWNDLIKNKVKLIPALALYKSGEIDNYAGSGKNEWIEYNNIIKKQLQVSRNINNYYGFSLFRYDFLVNNMNNENLNHEVNNFLSLFPK